MNIRHFVEQLQAWHERKVADLRTIVDHPEAPINIGDVKLEPGSDAAEGFRAGVSLSLGLLGKLPFSVVEDDEAEDR